LPFRLKVCHSGCSERSRTSKNGEQSSDCLKNAQTLDTESESSPSTAAGKKEKKANVCFASCWTRHFSTAAKDLSKHSQNQKIKSTQHRSPAAALTQGKSATPNMFSIAKLAIGCLAVLAMTCVTTAMALSDNVMAWTVATASQSPM